MSQKHLISIEIIRLTRKALDDHGEEAFIEMGPNEVIDLEDISSKYDRLPLNEKIQVSKDLKAYTRCSETLVNILMRIEDNYFMMDQEWNKEELTAILEAGNPLMKEEFPSLND